MSIDLHIDVEQVETQTILRLEGRLDTSSAPILEKRLQSLVQAHHYYLLLDFTNIEYLSSAGLRVLLAMSKQLKAHKGGLVLFSVDPEVMEIITLTGLKSVLHIVSSEQAALNALPKS